MFWHGVDLQGLTETFISRNLTENTYNKKSLGTTALKTHWFENPCVGVPAQSHRNSFALLQASYQLKTTLYQVILE